MQCRQAPAYRPHRRVVICLSSPIMASLHAMVFQAQDETFETGQGFVGNGESPSPLPLFPFLHTAPGHVHECPCPQLSRFSGMSWMQLRCHRLSRHFGGRPMGMICFAWQCAVRLKGKAADVSIIAHHLFLCPVVVQVSHVWSNCQLIDSLRSAAEPAHVCQPGVDPAG